MLIERGRPAGELLASIAEPREAAPLVAAERAAEGCGRLLPAPAAARVSLEAGLRGRTAVRAYDPTALSQAEVAALLHAASEIDAQVSPGSTAALELVLAAWRVDGLAPSLQRYDGRSHALEPLAPLPVGVAAEDLVLQREFARAPAVLVVMGDLRHAVRERGAHGHRRLLLRAGAATHAAWLAALELGLVGSIFAGLLPDELRRLGVADGYTRAPLLAFAVGHAPPGFPLTNDRHQKGGVR